jgi:uncharacterized protein involved in outer membrane biogenesis
MLLLVIISQLDLNRFKDTIESQVSELTGRQLTIGGDMRIDLSLQPLIRLEKVKFANASWGRQPQMLSIDLLQLEINLRPLLDSVLHVEKIILEGVDLSVETNADGVNNWQLEKFSTDEPEVTTTEYSSEPFQLPFLPILKKVKLNDIRFFYGDATSDIETEVVASLQLLHPDINEKVYLSANGRVNQHPFDISAEASFLTTVTAQNLIDQGINLKVNADALGAKLVVDGVIENPVSIEGVNIDISLNAADLDKTFMSATGQSLYQYLPKSDEALPLTFSANLVDIARGYELSAIKLELADTDIVGDLSYVKQPERPAFTAKLHSDKVNLNRFVAKFSGESEQPKSKKPTANNKIDAINLPDTELPFELLKSLDAVVEYSIGQFQFSQFEPKAIKLNATLDAGQLQIKQFDLQLDGAPVQSSFMIDSSARYPRISTRLNIDNLQLGKVLQGFNVDQLKSGLLKTRISLDTQGRSIKSLLLGLKGKATVELADGRVEFQVEDKTHLAEIDHFNLDFTGIKKPLKIDLDGRVGDEPLLLSGRLDSPVSIIENKRLKLKLKLAAAKINLEANGSITKPLNVDGAQLNIALEIQEPKESILKISRIVPAVQPNKNIPDIPFSLQGLLTVSQARLRFEQMKVKAGKSDLSGYVFVDVRGEKPVIDAGLESQLLDLNELVPATIQVSEEEKLKKEKEKEIEKNKNKKSKIFSTEPLPVLDVLDEVDISLKYKLSKLISNKQTIDNIGLKLAIKDSRLIIDPLLVNFSQGTIITKIDLNSIEQTQLDIDIEVIKLRYDRLMAILGTREYAKGELDAKIKLTGEGESVSELMTSLNGSIRLTTVDGELNQNSLKLLSKDLVSVIPFTDTSDRQKINCAVVQFNINNGIADTHSMVINTGAISALGTGGIDLTNETLSLYVAPRTKHTSLLQVALVPVNITGSLSSPSVKPDIAGSTISTTKTATNISLTIATGLIIVQEPWQATGLFLLVLSLKKMKMMKSLVF